MESLRTQLQQVFSRRLAALRQAAGLSQADLAERVELSTEFVSRMERGKTLPSLESFMPLREVLGCTADDLLDVELTPEVGLQRLETRLRRVDAEVAKRAVYLAEASIEYEMASVRRTRGS